MDFDNIENSSLADSQEILNPDKRTESKETFDSDLNNRNPKEQGVFEERRKSKDLDEKALYDEILKRLDAKKQNKKEGNQVNTNEKKLKDVLKMLNAAKEVNLKKQMGASVNGDFEKIQKLVKAGLIDSAQGQNLKKILLKKTFDKLLQAGQTKQTFTNNSSIKNQNTAKSDTSLDNFSANSEFFNQEGRNKVLEYLKSGGLSVGGEELNKISELVNIVEKSAVERYLQKAAHEKTLVNSNENAKQRLTANAQKSSRSEALSRTFTREQIGKMSGAEFAKYEPFIMEQLKKGLIK